MGKKFKYKQLQQMLIDHNALPMSKQREAIHDALEKWMHHDGVGYEQTDDVLLIGFRVN